MQSSWLSRLLRRLGRSAGGAHAAAAVAATVVVWVAAYAMSGFPDWMAVALQTTAAAVTLVMVFVIQHAQQRSEVAMQMKLDALIHASSADDELAEMEYAEGDELEHLTGGHDIG